MEDNMNDNELKELQTTLDADVDNIHSHALWMARVMSDIHKDPAFRKLGSAIREEIENICAAVE